VSTRGEPTAQENQQLRCRPKPEHGTLYSQPEAHAALNWQPRTNISWPNDTCLLTSDLASCQAIQSDNVMLLYTTTRPTPAAVCSQLSCISNNVGGHQYQHYHLLRLQASHTTHIAGLTKLNYILGWRLVGRVCSEILRQTLTPAPRQARPPL